MAVKAVSIEIGHLITRVCEVDYKTKTHKLYNSFVIENPEGTMADGTLNVSDEFVNLLKQAMVENKIKTKQLVVSISSTKIASRDVSIPFVKENRIPDVVRANASDYFPVDLSQYQLAYSVIGTEGDDKTGKKYRLNVLAAPNQILKDYYELASKLKMELLAIDYSNNSVYQIVKDSCGANETNLVIKVEGHTTSVIVVKNKNIAFGRALPYGVGDALDIIKNTDEWGIANNYLDAIKIANKNDTTDNENIKKSLETLVSAIGRLVEFFKSRGQDVSIDHIFLTGLGADFEGLDTIIAEGIGSKVEVYSKVKALSHNFSTSFTNLYIAAFGAAYAPVSLKQEDEKKKSKLALTPGNTAASGSKSAVDPVIIGVVVMAVGLIAAIGMVAFAGIRYAGLKAINTELNNRKSELSGVTEIYQQYMSTMTEYDAIRGVDAATTSFNDELVSFFEELEDRLPSDVAVSSFSADASNVTMTMKVSSKSEAAKVIEELREFKSLLSESVTVSSLSIEMDENSNMPISVSFTVNAMYNPNQDSEEASEVDAVPEVEVVE